MPITPHTLSPSGTRVSDFDYHLPDELIAQVPAEPRDHSRLLVVDRASGELTDSVFAKLGAWLRRDDLLVLNDTRVIPSRLIGRRQSGGRVELFLVEEIDDRTWVALARPASRIRRGDWIQCGPPREPLTVFIEAELDGARRRVRFAGDGPIWPDLERCGRTPLPPYIHRGGMADDPLDRERYQTVYAARRGAIAAPTAGLHFTPELLHDLASAGVSRTTLTLQVGYGTFQPVRVEFAEDHVVEPERYDIPESAVTAIASTRAAGGRVIAVGTTTTRALESATALGRVPCAGAGTATICIRPGHDFKCVDALITNFHLPRSSLLMLVAAFAGREGVLSAYEHAVRERYRFYSYGDAMLIV
jgi:S-adenosylmethionine:tRNA ribosyltransferase-isomerase